MGYCLKRDESIESGVQRIANRLIQQSLRDLADSQLDRGETVHEVRKRCKMMRGLLRLVRHTLDDAYERENACFRDAAKLLSGVRDKDAMIEAFDRLSNLADDIVDPQLIDHARTLLIQRTDNSDRGIQLLEPRIGQFVQTLQSASSRVPKWSCSSEGFAAIRGGFTKIYRRGRQSIRSLGKSPSDEQLHQFRKVVKYHWYHIRLLRDVGKSKFKKRAAQLEHLSDLLGDDHDLVVLKQTFAESPDFADIRRSDKFAELIEFIQHRRQHLQKQSRRLGKQLYRSKPSQLTERLRKHW